VCSYTCCCHSFMLTVRVDGVNGVVHGQINGAADEFHVAVIATYIQSSTRTFRGA